MAEADITRLLLELEEGRRDAFDRLLVHVYPELRKLARARLRAQRNAETLNTTALVHEAYLRMVRYQEVSWKGRSHFFGAAAQTMRRILVDHARAQATEKRSAEHVTLDDETADSGADLSLEQMLELDNALRRLEQEHPRWVRVVECRYFAGLNIEETAEALDISHGTVSNDWRMARAWLKRELA